MSLAHAMGRNTTVLKTSRTRPQSAAERELIVATSAAILTKSVSTNQSVEVYTYSVAGQEEESRLVSPAARTRGLAQTIQSCPLLEWLSLGWVTAWMQR